LVFENSDFPSIPLVFLTFLLSLSLLQRENLKRDFPVPSLPLPFAKGELKRDFPVPSLPLPFAKGESKRD
jgi:hypothetical protein